MATEMNYILGMDFMGGEVDFYPSVKQGEVKNVLNDESALSGGLLFTDESLFSDFEHLEDPLVSNGWPEKPDWFAADPFARQDSSQKIPSLEDVLEDIRPPLTPGGLSTAPSSGVGSPLPSDGGDEFLIGNYSPRTIANLEELLDHSALSATYNEESPPSHILATEPIISDSNPNSPSISTVESPTEFILETVTSLAQLDETPSKRNNSRTAPYPKSSPKRQRSDEQRCRKRQQNRDAALRYRSKKKDELGRLVAEADKLEETNKKLNEQVMTVSKEIEYLKNLMLDVIKARLDKSV